MASPSNTSIGRSASSYEKMLVADTFLIIGCILFSFGLGLVFYSVPVNAQDTVTTLDSSNAYSQNFTIPLNIGDILVLGVKPYALANITLLLLDADFQVTVEYRSTEPGALLNFTYTAGTSGVYVARVMENLTDPSNRAVVCQLEAMSVVSLISPARPYIFFGIILVVIGAASFLFSRRVGVRVKQPGEWYDSRGYVLPSLFLVSTIGFASVFSVYMLGGSVQLGTVGEVLLVAFPALNICALLLGITILRDKPLTAFLRLLLLSVAIWFAALSILVVLLPFIFLQSTPYWDLAMFLATMQGIVSMNSAFTQIVTLVVILVIAYCLSYRYGKHRIFSSEVETELLDAGTYRTLLRELESAVGKKDLEEFFGRIKDKELEASVFLFYMLSDHSSTGANSFTYHSIISGRRDVFSKDIYERDPAQKILKPLGFLKVSGAGRFRRYKLQVREPLVNRLVNLFKEAVEKKELDSLSKWSGVDLLKERRMRYAGQLKSKNESADES